MKYNQQSFEAFWIYWYIYLQTVVSWKQRMFQTLYKFSSNKVQIVAFKQTMW